MARTYLRKYFEIQDVIYFLMTATLMGILSYPHAATFEVSGLQARLMASLSYFVAAMCMTSIYCSMARTAKPRKILMAGGLMLLVSSATYSIVRQQWILLVYPSLFCLPGVVFGASTGSFIRRKIGTLC